MDKKGALPIILIVIAVVAGILFYVFSVTDSKIVAIAESEVSKTLNDPYSAKFSGVVVKRNSNEKLSDFYRVCGFVNSKNLYGAYTGNKPFIMSVIATGSETIRVVDGTMRIGVDSFTDEVIIALCNE
ncbi:hypothetical protein [Providencia sneebia]|uniref:Uncharacterized protein n=1 Tax=Providencia sneebia DSM 19967 TaxID=1141660 RepID=K8W4J6_9GAMM|nr:hypothetical protein [Providencia sneebia]EKT55508.1 hypothetical protein OO7_11009 [Providencia sneebia DSM 19967]